MKYCHNCEGRGTVVGDKEDLRVFLNYAQERCTFGDIREFIRMAKEEGEVPCLLCEGRGKYETQES